MTTRQITITLPDATAGELFAAHNAYRDVIEELDAKGTPTDVKLWARVLEAETRFARACEDTFDYLDDEADEANPIRTLLALAGDVLTARADVGGSFVRADAALAAQREAAMGTISKPLA